MAYWERFTGSPLGGKTLIALTSTLERKQEPDEKSACLINYFILYFSLLPGLFSSFLLLPLKGKQ